MSANSQESLTCQSVQALHEYEQRLAGVYADARDYWGYLDLTGAWPADKGTGQANLAALAGWVKMQVAARLEA
ncbi:hypothetical protein D3C76_1227920 [compost metagenome]